MAKTAGEQRKIVPVGRPFKKGQSGNPNGRPKGRISLSTMVKKLVEDPDLVEKVIKDDKDLPNWWPQMPEKSFAAAITMSMLHKAVVDKSVEAASWVRKTGYGDLLDEEEDGEKSLTSTLDELDDLDTQRDEVAAQAERALHEQLRGSPADDEAGSPPQEQVVEDDAPVQDQGQAGADRDVQAERNAAEAPGGEAQH